MDPVVELSLYLEQLSRQVAYLHAQVMQLSMAHAWGHGEPRPQPVGPAPAPAAAGRTATRTRNTQVYVDRARCLGCGLCVRLAPRTFFLDWQTGRAMAAEEPQDPAAAIHLAVSRCPVHAIHYR